MRIAVRRSGPGRQAGSCMLDADDIHPGFAWRSGSEFLPCLDSFFIRGEPVESGSEVLAHGKTLDLSACLVRAGGVEADRVFSVSRAF